MEFPDWFNDFNTVAGAVSSLIGIASAMLSALAWQKAKSIRRQQIEDERRRSEPISLLLINETNQQEHLLEYRPRRDQASRAEILGILGMYLGAQRFDPSRLVKVLECGDFDRMMSGQTDVLRFQVSPETFGQILRQDQKTSC